MITSTGTTGTVGMGTGMGMGIDHDNADDWDADGTHASGLVNSVSRIDRTRTGVFEGTVTGMPA